MFDKLLTKEFKKYGIDPESVEYGKRLKCLTKDEKWEIALNFFNENDKKVNLLSDKKSYMFTIIFPSGIEAMKFVQNPTVGISAKARKFVVDRGEKFEDYDIFFNLSIIYDESPKNKKPNIVEVRLI